MVGASFSQYKVCDCEGSILHVSSFYRTVKLEHPPEKKAARQAYTLRHFILSWTLELWDLKALNATLEGKYKWKLSVCGHFINISLGYPPPLSPKQKCSHPTFGHIKIKILKMTSFVSGIDFTPKHCLIFRIACLIWTSVRSDTVTTRVGNWLTDSVMTSQGLAFT